MSKAKSLVAIHLSGNPGINEEIIEYARWKLRCRDNLNYEILLESQVIKAAR